LVDRGLAEFRLRDIPDALWKEFRKLAIDEDTSANELLIRLISEAVERAKKGGLP
jgi:hypothetical protein